MADASPSSSDPIDKFSNLPDHLLLHILALLPTKDAVKASVLSKPWQRLWTLVPAIDLCDDGFSDDNGFSRVKSFQDLVRKVLDSNKSPVIRRFCLAGKRCPIFSLDKLLSYATERIVEELDFTFDTGGYYFHRCTIPSWRAPKSLVVMKLRMNKYNHSQLVINIGTNLESYFPTLKVLHLSNVWFEGPDPSFSGIFASRFPLLEELVIEGGRFHHDLNISLPKLRRFEFDYACLESKSKLRLNMEAPSLQCLVLWGSVSDSGGFHEENLHSLLDASLSSRFPLLEELVVIGAKFRRDINISLPNLRRLKIVYARSGKCTLNIDARSLQYLDLSQFERGRFPAENLHNLAEANVDVFATTRNKKYYDYEYGKSLIKFVNALFNVRRLNLSHETMQELSFASSRPFFHTERIRPFRNLMNLDLEIDGSVLGMMMIMLSNFENLEHLKIKESDRKYDKTKYSLAPPTHVPSCLTNHLKTFCFNRFTASKYEMEFTIYILKNSLVLKNAKIVYRRGLIWKKGNCNETILSTTCRGSMECQLEFDNGSC